MRSKTNRIGKEGCCGKGCNGCLVFWHDDMYVADLRKESMVWESLPQPFKRRAIAVGVLDGDIYAVGGMDSEDDTSSEVNIYDPIARSWRSGPHLPNGPILDSHKHE